jgi:nucleoside-diphosphate-sugar epimerase
MRACLVTGGSGFVGREVVRSLEEKGHDVTILGRTSAAGHRTILADLTRDEIDLRAETFQRVYHVAGLAHLEPRTREEARRFTLVNVEGTRNLLAAAERCREPPEALLLVSTVAVYGVEAGDLLDETTERRAADPYGLSKRRAEDLVLSWGELRGVRIGIVRLPLVVGPGAPGNLGRMISAVAAGRYVGVGAGTARRSMVRVADVAEILPKISETGGVFHLTDGAHPSFAELEATLTAALGRRPPRRVPTAAARLAAIAGDAIELLTRKRMPFDSRTLAKMVSTLTFSDEKARRELGWKPTRVLDHVRELVGDQVPPHSK